MTSVSTQVRNFFPHSDSRLPTTGACVLTQLLTAVEISVTFAPMNGMTSVFTQSRNASLHFDISPAMIGALVVIHEPMAVEISAILSPMNGMTSFCTQPRNVVPHADSFPAITGTLSVTHVWIAVVISPSFVPMKGSTSVVTQLRNIFPHPCNIVTSGPVSPVVMAVMMLFTSPCICPAMLVSIVIMPPAPGTTALSASVRKPTLSEASKKPWAKFMTVLMPGVMTLFKKSVRRGSSAVPRMICSVSSEPFSCSWAKLKPIWRLAACSAAVPALSIDSVIAS